MHKTYEITLLLEDHQDEEDCFYENPQEFLKMEIIDNLQTEFRIIKSWIKEIKDLSSKKR